MSFSLNRARLLMVILWFSSAWNCVQPAAEKIETIQLKTLALNDGSTENDDICNQVRTGQTGILALGASPYRFLLISTNLFVYEMALSAQDPEQNPPFKLLVTGRPVSLRDRWPEAYSWAQSHSGDILYAFVSTQYHFQAEYVIFMYRTNVSVCSVALDLNSGALLSGPCDDSFEEYEATSIGMPPQGGSLPPIPTVSRQNGGTTVCLHVGMLFAAEPKREDDLPVPCNTFDQCRYFYVFPPELSPPECLAPHPNPIVTIFQYRLEKIYMIDSAGQVHQAHLAGGPDYLKVSPLPLDKFIGCNEADTIKLQFGEKWLWIVIVLGLLLQVGICALIFFVFGRWNQLPASDKEIGGGRSRSGSPKSSLRRSSKSKNSLRRSSKSRSSLRRSSKSKSSIGGRSGSSIRSPKSRSVAPSTSSKSRSVSMQRPSLSRNSTSKASMSSSKSTSRRSPSNKSHLSKANSSVSHSTSSTHKKSSK